MPRMTLDGKTALVTGGARRVGRAIVEELARAGCRVVIHHASSDAEAAALASALATGDYTPLVIRADLRDRQAARTLVDAAVAATGKLDILVNSAAGYARTPLSTMSDDVWDEMQALNVAAPMRLMREAARAGVSAIVNLVDVAAWQPWASWSAYATSKAALLHLSRCLALELAPRTRVNCIAPGTVIFPDDWDAARRALQLQKIPLQHEGSPADVARVARFLCENEFLTGVCMPVDGGAGLR
ncbi:MAG: 3-oxoacyl-[acyl-carrier protein] reductase [Myxococcales bacterium]|nr:3-oxoacyl-[acyl-carrier protein] reductase [Myxococcales bacterium]